MYNRLTHTHTYTEIDKFALLSSPYLRHLLFLVFFSNKCLFKKFSTQKIQSINQIETAASTYSFARSFMTILKMLPNRFHCIIIITNVIIDDM